MWHWLKLFGPGGERLQNYSQDDRLQGLGKFTASQDAVDPHHAGALRRQRKIKQQPLASFNSVRGAADASARERQVIYLKQKSTWSALSFDDGANSKALLVPRADTDFFFCCIIHDCEGLASTG